MNINTTIEKDFYSVKLTAEENGEVLGWIYLYVLGNSRHEEPWGFLENLYVEPEHRSKGIGRQLVSAAIEEAKKRDCYKLLGTTRHTKPELHAFYERFGFKNWGVEFRMDLKDSKTKQAD